MAGKARHRGFGHIRKLPSGRYQASYLGGDASRHNAPGTFETRSAAEVWLASEQQLVASGTWSSPAARVQAAHAAARGVLTFAVYADRWIEERDIRPKTRSHYRTLFKAHLKPMFGDLPLTVISPDAVRSWHALMGSSRPTLRAHSYGLLRSILASAERDQLIVSNPCHIRGAGNSRRVHKIEPLTLDELAQLVLAMPERLRAMTLLATWCALRFGELAELRRSDIDIRDPKRAVVRVRRAVVHVDGEFIVGRPKSEAGVRDVAIPPHLVPILKDHIAGIAFGRDALLFPGRDGGHLATSTLYGRAPTKTRAGHGFYAARVAAGRPDLRWHDLRHTGAVLAAQTGATLAELMGRLGHSTPGAAMRYQHAAAGRDAEIAAALSKLAGAEA